MSIFFLYIMLGCVSGFLSGLLGLGGGIIIVPILSVLFAHFHIVGNFQLMHLTIGTSLAISIVSLSASIKVHYQHQAITWKIFWAMSPGIIIGSILLGPLLLLFITGNFLKFLFGCFCIFVAAQIFLTQHSILHTPRSPNPYKMTFWGILSGILSTLLGVSGGALVGSILNYYCRDMYKIIGTTTAICIIAAISGTFGLLLLNHHPAELPDSTTGFIYWPAFFWIAAPSLVTTPLGSRLTHKLPLDLLKKLFASLLLLTGIKMLF